MLEFYVVWGLCFFFDENFVFDIGSLIVGGVDLLFGCVIFDDGDLCIDYLLEGFFFICGLDYICYLELVEGVEGRKYLLYGLFLVCLVEVMEFCNGWFFFMVCVMVMVWLVDGGFVWLEWCWYIDGVIGVVLFNDKVMNVGVKFFVLMLMYYMNIGVKNFDVKM